MVTKRICFKTSLFLIVLGCWAGSAQAQLAGLVHDPLAQELSVVAIDSADGSVTLGTPVSNCCRFTSGLVTSDPAAEVFYTVGTFLGGPLLDQQTLVALAFDGTDANAAVVGTPIESVLEFDSSNNTLVSMKTDDLTTGLQLIVIDPVSGSVFPIPTFNANCCEVVTGVSELDAATRRLYFTGRAQGEVNWSLYGGDLTTGAVAPIIALPPGSPGFMGLNADTGVMEVMMQNQLSGNSQLIGVDLASPGVTMLAEHDDPECCLFTVGQTPSISPDGDAWWLAGSNTGLEDALVALSRQGLNAPTRVQPIEELGLHLMAVVVNGNTVSLDTLFRDRFQL